MSLDKCEFTCRKLVFLGHVINQSGVQADPEKTTLAIQVMKFPTNISEMNRLLGMANQLGKFTPKLAELMNHYMCWSSKTVPGSIRIS